MAVLDATALLYFFEPEARPPIDPATDQPVTNATGRIKLLVDTLEERREAIVIPTPALSEVLVHANEAAPQYLEILNKTSCFRTASYSDDRDIATLGEPIGFTIVPIHKLPSPTGQEGFYWNSESPE